MKALFFFFVCLLVESIDLEILKDELHHTEKDGANMGQLAKKLYCQCDRTTQDLPNLCQSIKQQCRTTLCNPLCLRLAWFPTIEVDCNRAVGWKWCSKFAEQVKEAEEAVQAQFQAEICQRTGFCKSNSLVQKEGYSLTEWVENFNYGDHYPQHKLPMKICNFDQMELGVSENKTKIAQTLCQACQAVTLVKIQRGSCLPNLPDQPLQETSLQARCQFVGDAIGQRLPIFQELLQNHVCSCLGCCPNLDSQQNGEIVGQCFFPDTQKQFLSNVINLVHLELKEKFNKTFGL